MKTGPRPPIRKLAKPAPSTKSKPNGEPKSKPNGEPKTTMKLFNVITLHDFFVLAVDHDDARATADEIIRSGEQAVYDQVAYETTKEREIREQWKTKPPWVSASIVDYDPIESDTCLVLHGKIYSRR